MNKTNKRTAIARWGICAIFALCGTVKVYAQTAPPYECLGAYPSGSTSTTSSAVAPGVSLPCAPHSTAFTSFYQQKENYIPDNTTAGALYVNKTIKIAIHVIQPTYPADLNFKSSDESIIRTFMNQANGYLINNDAPTDPITVGGRDPWVRDTRFRLDIQSIDFRNDVNLTFDDVYGVSPAPYSILASAGLFTNYDNVLNVFIMYSTLNTTPGGVTYLTPNDPDPIYGHDDLYHPTTDNRSPFIILKNFYSNIGFRNSPEACANFFLHELGHALGMYHVYYLDYGKVAATPENINESYYDYLQDVFGSTATTKFNYRPYDNGTYPSAPGEFGVPGDDYTNNFMAGNTSGHYYSPMQLGRMHRNAYFLNCRNFIYNTTPEDNSHNHTGEGQNTPLVISNSETWDFDIKMYNDIVVKSGATLTIACRVMMPHFANIIVEKGATLIVDGGIITSDRTNDFWYGISVLGDATQSQDGAGNQGMVITRNGATISNAMHAITAGDDVAKDFSKSGGILRIDNTHFSNNKHSIAFWSFENTAFGTGSSFYVHKPNRSYIQNSTLDLDDNYNYDNATNPDFKPLCQISAWDVDGVRIKGCTLANNMSLAKRNRIGGSGDGIITFEGDFTLSDYCPASIYGGSCAPSAIIPSTVQGFTNGINAQAVVSKPFTALNTTFNNNLNGVNMSGIGNAHIHDNNFVLGDPAGLSAYTLGIQAYGANAYSIYNNNFSVLSSLFYNPVGVNIIEGGSDENKVNNNTYYGINIGNMSQGRNTNGDHPGHEIDNHGLQFLCNIYNTNNSDQYVYGSDATQDGIRSNQGTADAPAGNQFTNLYPSPGLIVDMNHITTYQSGSSAVDRVLPITAYYYSTTSGVFQQPLRYTSGRVTPVPKPRNSPCTLPTDGDGPYHIIGGGLSTTSFSTLRMAFDDSSSERNNLIANAYQGMHSAYADAELSMFYISHGNIATGLALYNSILTNTAYQLSTKEQYEFAQGNTLVQILAAHYQNQIPMTSLSTTDINSLHYLTANTQMWPRAKACAWLHFANGEECPALPVELPAHAPNTQRSMASAGIANSLTIAPNPTSSYYTLQYHLQSDAKLTITDISGRMVAQYTLPANSNTLRIDADNWQTGVYLYQVTQGAQSLYYGKLLKY